MQQTDAWRADQTEIYHFIMIKPAFCLRKGMVSTNCHILLQWDFNAFWRFTESIYWLQNPKMMRHETCRLGRNWLFETRGEEIDTWTSYYREISMHFGGLLSQFIDYKTQRWWEMNRRLGRNWLFETRGEETGISRQERHGKNVSACRRLHLKELANQNWSF